MTPQEKANSLVNRFLDHCWHNEQVNKGFGVTGIKTVYNKKEAIECALIAVDEILLANPTWFIDQMQSTHKYWEDVRAVLNAL